MSMSLDSVEDFSEVMRQFGRDMVVMCWAQNVLLPLIHLFIYLLAKVKNIVVVISDYFALLAQNGSAQPRNNTL